jgi:outer membrane protein assembly factor BamB
MKSKFYIATALAGVLAAAVAVTSISHAQTTYSAEHSTIGDLLANPQIRPLFDKYFARLANSPQLSQALEKTLPDIEADNRGIVPDGVVTNAKITEMDADLRKLATESETAVQRPAPPAADDWPTWGYDSHRTGWNQGEKTLNASNVGNLKVIWSAKLDVPLNKDVLSTMTAPVIAANMTVNGQTHDVMFILGANDTLYALDAQTGAKLWQKSFPNPHKATTPASWLCPNTANDTPTIDKKRGIVFFIPSDGKLRGVSVANGSEVLKPVQMVAPFARAWSLNLIGDVVYSPSGRACGEVLDKDSVMGAAALSGRRRAIPGVLHDASAVNAVNTADLKNPIVTHFFTSGARPAAPWGRGGAVKGPNNSVLVETSDGLYDPAAGNYSESILRIAPQAARLMDSFTPKNWRDNLAHDMSGSATPVIFPFADKTIVAASQKEAVLRLLDADRLGGSDHMTPLWASPKLGNDAKIGTDPGQGVWGAIATWESPDHRRFLYLPMQGPLSEDNLTFPKTNGPVPDGTILAFEVVKNGDAISAAPRWRATNMIMPDPPVVANGVVYAISTGGQAMQNYTTSDYKKLHSPRLPWPVSAVLRSTPVSNLKLYAYDAVTGKQLFDSGDAIPDWVHFSEPVVALGKVYVVTHDAHVYAFGLK